MGPVEDERAQIAGIELVLTHAFLLRGIELLRAERNRHPEDPRRPEQPLRMVAQAKNGGTVDGLVAAYAFEDAHAVMQRMGEDVRLRVAPRHHLAVVPDPPIAVGHRHGGLSFAAKNAILTEKGRAAGSVMRLGARVLARRISAARQMPAAKAHARRFAAPPVRPNRHARAARRSAGPCAASDDIRDTRPPLALRVRKSTRLNSSHVSISY